MDSLLEIAPDRSFTADGIHIYRPASAVGEKKPIGDGYRPSCYCNKCHRFTRLTHIAPMFRKIDFGDGFPLWEQTSAKCWGDCSKCGHVEISWVGEYPWEEPDYD